MSRASTQAHGRSRGALPVDGAVLLAGLFLLGLGVVMSYSATAPLAIQDRIPPLFVKHVAAAAGGIAVAALAIAVPLAIWRWLALPLWCAGAALLVATAAFGVEVNGAQRWLAVPFLDFRFQPVEITKLTTLLAVAAVVAPRDGHRELSVRRAAVAAGLTLPLVVLLLFQPDLGSAVLLAGLVGLVLVAAGTPLRQLALPALATPLAIGLYAWTHPYAWRRLVVFRDPWSQYEEGGFQLVQSIVAFNEGGFSGVGLGDGRQKLFYLPEAHTDFILSLVAEELGLIGVLAVLGAFVALVIAGTRIARSARDRFGLLVAFGMTGLLAVPAMVNAAVVMGLLPTKGLTLPFLSYGRTSLVVCCFAAGLLLAIGRDGTRGARGTQSGSRRRSGQRS
ncbi:MAG: FtsW/RodA/SpoVE family cell cycle protein [Proteobacteria bacterium]|nr:FtsW/RodA/SpoVE family cell cycle protein [Pseudomonadota bacterium]MCZ6781795.1 FtsW/RodA/SpoVE family cell cycle protein [Pseudomonadota bacterium]